MSTKKTPAKKSVKKVTDKKSVKKVTAKKSVKKVAGQKVTTKRKSTAKKIVAREPVTQSELGKMIAKIIVAKQNGEKSVVVYTTSKDSHKANTGGSGFGASDLKPKLLEAYKHLLVNYDLQTRLVSMTDMAVEWIVKIKK